MGVWLAALSLPALAAGQESPDAEPPRSATNTLQRKAAELRAAGFLGTRTAAEAALGKAEAGQCGEALRRRSEHFREILAAADDLAAKATHATERQPGKAAMLYVQAEKIARGLVTGLAAKDCPPAPK